MKKILSKRFFTEKDTSGMISRTSHPQLSEKGCQHGEEDSIDKIVLKRAHYWRKSQDSQNNISILPA